MSSLAASQEIIERRGLPPPCRNVKEGPLEVPENPRGEENRSRVAPSPYHVVLACRLDADDDPSR